MDYSKLKKSFVIFICNYDPFGKERYIYAFENRCIEEDGLTFGDETLKVIVNTKGTVGEISEGLKEVLVYLDKGMATGEYTRQLDEAVRLVKASEERRHEYMVMMIHDMEVREEGREEGRKEGREEGKIIGTIETYREIGLDDQTIIKNIIMKYNLDQEEAGKYVFSVADAAV